MKNSERKLIVLLEKMIERFAYFDGKCEDCGAEFRWSAAKKAHVPHEAKCLIGKVEKSLEESRS